MIITSKDKICIEEDFKVEAGPGAGKTEFLVNHIKNVLQNSTRMACTRKIACITYTNTAVETILKRLGNGVADKVEVSTIHSFLYKNVVKPYCAFIPAEYELCCKKINGHEDFYINNKYIREWFESEDFSGLKHPNTEKQILSLPALNQALQNWILSIKCIFKNGVIGFKCDNTKAVGFDKKSNARIGINANNLRILSEKITGLKKIYWRKGKLDHNDILFFSYTLIDRYPFLLDILRAKFPYMFIDEYQDTNPVQSLILDAIRKKETVVGVIGDKAQSIYAFQGAEPSLFDLFKVDKNNVFTINDNHRSTNQIVKFLNDIRNDIRQDACSNIDDIDVILYVGDRNTAYDRACGICHKGPVESLSRDNVTSNAMKKDIESGDINGKLVEQFESADSSSERRNYILFFIQAIELSINGKYKEALKSIEWIFRTEESPKKAALSSLIKILSVYNDYCNDSLMKFYDTICAVLSAKLPTFRNGAAKDFYNNNLYKNIAICINIAEDTSNHITIHKAKGSEFENVLVIGSNNIREFLCAPDLKGKEEHRIIYVAISRARKRLFLNVNELDDMGAKELEKRYNYLNVQRL
jgi:DNA helicase-2/ATP-dependent DNA helicase PcrA